MVYVAPPDNELLYSAQVEVHAKRGGPQVLFPKEDDKEVVELYEKKKAERDENRSKAENAGELISGLHVPPASENPETVLIGGQKFPNKNLSTPGAAPLVSDNVGVQKEPDEKADRVNPVTGEVIKAEDVKVDPVSGLPVKKEETEKTSSPELSSLTASTSIEETDISKLSEEERLERLKAGK